jgi:hypothetical protein
MCKDLEYPNQVKVEISGLGGQCYSQFNGIWICDFVIAPLSYLNEPQFYYSHCRWRYSFDPMKCDAIYEITVSWRVQVFTTVGNFVVIIRNVQPLLDVKFVAGQTTYGPIDCNNMNITCSYFGATAIISTPV